MHEHQHHHHRHNGAEERYSDRAHPEYVVLDIGGELGALIVYADASLHGTEVEISREGQDDRRSHKDVLARGRDTDPAFTAVFDKLPAGTYTLWSDGVPRERGVQITGGVVGELDWRTSAPLHAA